MKDKEWKLEELLAVRQIALETGEADATLRAIDRAISETSESEELPPQILQQQLAEEQHLEEKTKVNHIFGLELTSKSI